MNNEHYQSIQIYPEHTRKMRNKLEVLLEISYFLPIIQDLVRTKTGEIRRMPFFPTDEHGNAREIAQPDDNA